jgi:hypothetical protein
MSQGWFVLGKKNENAFHRFRGVSFLQTGRSFIWSQSTTSIMTEVHLLRVFSAGTGGGNLLTVVLNAKDMSNAEMQAVATKHGHECGFVFPASDCDYGFRF